MIALGGQRFVGVSQADETRGERPKRVNHAIRQEHDRASALSGLWIGRRNREIGIVARSQAASGEQIAVTGYIDRPGG
jgi:hypothetical protein